MKRENKILIAVVILSIATVLIVANFAVLEKIVKKEPGPETIKANGLLSFEPAANQYQEAEVFSVNIIVDGDGQPIVGADIVIKYDSSIVEVETENTDSVKPEAGFFVVFPADGQTQDGLFQFSLLSQEPKVFKGKIATVYFLAKKAGQAKLEFVFEKGRTDDSNLALFSKGIDLLASVGAATIQIIK